MFTFRYKSGVLKNLVDVCEVHEVLAQRYLVFQGTPKRAFLNTEPIMQVEYKHVATLRYLLLSDRGHLPFGGF